MFFFLITTDLTRRAPIPGWPRGPSFSHRSRDSLDQRATFADVKEALVVVEGVVLQSVPRGGDGVHVEIGGVAVDGVRGAVCGGEGVGV